MENKAGLPSEVSIWSKIRGVLCKEIKITDAELTLTPRQERIFRKIHDFWNQEITGQKMHDFLFKEVEIIDNIEL